MLGLTEGGVGKSEHHVHPQVRVIGPRITIVLIVTSMVVILYVA